MITDYHAKYFARQLTRRIAADDPEKLSATLVDAQVDLNPHQVEAALFAFKSPLSNGAVLADEVGLGKTIEAGIVLSQFWAEKKRNILLIMPSSLRKQWYQELQEKFFLPSIIMDSQKLKKEIKNGIPNPFDTDRIVICSYHFAKNKEALIAGVRWDLVLLDEAHRIRNVHKPDNKIGRAIKRATAPYSKLLLTATPLQNSTLELFGLVSMIDDYVFGDKKSFKKRFSRPGDHEIADLRRRMQKVCKRTLRKQVVEYVPYTEKNTLYTAIRTLRRRAGAV